MRHAKAPVTQVSWPKFNTRDLLIAMVLLGFGFTWPILLILIAPIIGAVVLARMGLDAPALRALFFFASIYPMLWLAIVNVMWSITWQILGRRPSPGNDDPAHISPFVSALYDVAAVMFFGLPFAFFAGLISLMLIVDTPPRRLKFAGVVFVAIWLACGVWWASDPREAIEWFFD
jgi:hypothetical protein